MPEQLADHVEGYTASSGKRGVGMPQIVQANVLQPSVLAGDDPRSQKLLNGLPCLAPAITYVQHAGRYATPRRRHRSGEWYAARWSCYQAT